jgi:chromate transporter
MSFLLLYGLFLKASLSSFSGLASLPIVRQDLVLKHHVLNDHQLNTAVVIGRTTPGPLGLYMISAGYYVAGARGALAAGLALTTPALLVIPLMVFAGRATAHPRAQQMLRAVVLATAGVSLSATLPLAADALHSPLAYGVAGVSCVLLLFTEIDTLWVMFGAVIVGWLGLLLKR